MGAKVDSVRKRNMVKAKVQRVLKVIFLLFIKHIVEFMAVLSIKMLNNPKDFSGCRCPGVLSSPR